MVTDSRRRGAGQGDAGEPLQLQWRPYRFTLPREMVTSQGTWSERRGWLLKLEAKDGGLSWGEGALLPAQIGSDAGAAQAGPTVNPSAELPGELRREELERWLPDLPAPLACAVGMALAELDGLGSGPQGGWLQAPASAILLPAGTAAIAALERALAERRPPQDTGERESTPRADWRGSRVRDHARPIQPQGSGTAPLEAGPRGLTVKWKVASDDDTGEREVMEALLQRLPADSRLRLDANGGWDRATARRWAERLAAEPRLDWLEQPLPAGDDEGLRALAAMVPVALDESLRADSQGITRGWPGWLVRRPLLEGDPRPLLTALLAGTPRLMLSTTLETGIGRRFLEHLAGLQALGPTPTAPGLAPGWRPAGALFSADPQTVWQGAEAR